MNQLSRRSTLAVARIALLTALALAGVFVTARDAAVNAQIPIIRQGQAWIFENSNERFERSFSEAVTNNGDTTRLLRLARAALRQEPLTPEAILMLASPARSSGLSTPSDSQILHLAERVSKRSLPVQIALIEQAVAQSDVSGALVHYDRAMSAHQTSTDIFFPVLTAAAETKEIRMALVPYVLAGRWWTGPFLQHISGNLSPPALADFFRSFGGGRRVPAARPLEKIVLQRLLDVRDFDTAWSYAVGMKASGSYGLYAVGLNVDSTDPVFGPLAWTSSGDGGIDVNFDLSTGLAITVPAGARGDALSRVMPVQKGTWRFVQYVEAPAGDPSGRLTWDASCLTTMGDDRILSETTILKPGRNQYQFTLHLAADCRAVRFQLRADGGDLPMDMTIGIRALSLTKA